MARVPTPWRRKGEGGAWYSTVGGRKVRLAGPRATKAEAAAALARLLAERKQGRAVPRHGLTVKDVANLYLADRMKASEAGAITAKRATAVRHALRDLCRKFGAVPAAGLSPAEVEAWLAATATGDTRSGRPWGRAMQATTGAIVRTCFRWAARGRLLAPNPLEGLKVPGHPPRDADLTEADAAALIAACPGPLADFLRGLYLTGCRPSEAAGLTIDRVDLQAGTWRVLDKIRGKTGVEHRTVYLPEEAVELTRRLIEGRTEGHVFRNAYGDPWRPHAWGQAVRKHRGGKAVAYAFRHLYATRKLVAGVPVATVAALLGHRSSAMVERIYSKLDRQTDHLRDAANKG